MPGELYLRAFSHMYIDDAPAHFIYVRLIFGGHYLMLFDGFLELFIYSTARHVR